jgi:hypothetical protein
MAKGRGGLRDPDRAPSDPTLAGWMLRSRCCSTRPARPVCWRRPFWQKAAPNLRVLCLSEAVAAPLLGLSEPGLWPSRRVRTKPRCWSCSTAKPDVAKRGGVGHEWTMNAAPDPAEIVAPSDPALYARRRVMGPGVWVWLILCVLCIAWGRGRPLRPDPVRAQGPTSPARSPRRPARTRSPTASPRLGPAGGTVTSRSGPARRRRRAPGRPNRRPGSQSAG